MVATATNHRDDAALKYILISNLLPLIGIGVFEWNAAEVMFAYWIAMTLCIGIYGGLVLFTPQEPDPEEVVAPTLSVPFFPDTSGSIQFAERSLTIYHQNIKYALGCVCIGLVFWLFSGTVLLDLLNPEPTIQGGRFDQPIREYGAVVTTAASLGGVGVGILMEGIRLRSVHRDFFVCGRIARISPAALAQIPFWVGLYWFVVAIATQCFLLITWPLGGGFDPLVFTEIRVLAVFLGAKLVLERALIRSQRGKDPGRVVRLLTIDYATRIRLRAE